MVFFELGVTIAVCMRYTTVLPADIPLPWYCYCTSTKRNCLCIFLL